jgi:glycosyltransferase involved in cell wall biosynthesis
LLVSKSFPRDLRTNVNGVFQRLRMFVDAAKEIARLDALFFVAPGVETSSGAVARFETALCRVWNADLRLFLCPQQAQPECSNWAQYGESALSLFRQPGYREVSGPLQVQALEETVDRCRPDVILAHRLTAMCPPLLTRRRLPRIVFDLDDIEHVSWLRSIGASPGWRTRQLQRARLPALWWGERRAIKLADRTLVCSEDDRAYLEALWRLPNVGSVPNGVEIGTPSPVPPDPLLLFIGSYRYAPNVQAAEFLIEKVWPRIQSARPEAQLVLAGAAPENIPGYGAPLPGVRFPGFVEDLADLYRKARVVCCPVFTGGGTRIKIIEAATHGRPVVASRVGAEGLEMSDGQELLLRDEPQSFAAACVELLRDAERCERLASAAYRKTAERYDRRKILPVIQKHLRGD